MLLLRGLHFDGFNYGQHAGQSIKGNPPFFLLKNKLKLRRRACSTQVRIWTEGHWNCDAM